MGAKPVSSRTMKVRGNSKTANSARLAGRMARQDAEIADLKEQLVAALRRIDKLEQENARLKQQLAAARKNSSTSSKPPSSDIVKPKNPRGKGGKKRRRGGQPGHPRHERPERRSFAWRLPGSRKANTPRT